MRDDCCQCQHLVSDLLRPALLFCIQNLRTLYFKETFKGKGRMRPVIHLAHSFLTHGSNILNLYLLTTDVLAIETQQ